jgi:hypothetical protein
MDMVGDGAQLYTIEGVASAILMIITTFVILNSTYMITPSDTHISDMQLEQLGNDVLKMMDTAIDYNVTGASLYEKRQSFLEEELSKDFVHNATIKSNIISNFNGKFHNYAGDSENRIKLSADIYYWDGTNVLTPGLWDYTNPNAALFTNRDHYVTVTKWVYLKNPEWDNTNDPKTVLLEVRLWQN